ncbi:hypothetical protein [Aeromicrobium duanguangcaii]|uniref:hypothetical protein n=1 Tax=Aeromicrobium duanguangcaii TaxID=2968086 RepID=UPI002017CCA1|nr:hypothetical protein [Aeromicrobium duanguangcaii]MCL3836879.1 hypothetical protein [Aeromicrobium duanguangcaii]
MIATNLRASFAQLPHLGGLPTRANTSVTLQHIPGQTLRGALASAYLRTHGRAAVNTPEFVRLFEGGVRFGPLLPASRRPSPLSLREHKYSRTPGCDEDVDLALDPEAKHLEVCKTCGSPLELGKGILKKSIESVATRRHTAVDEAGQAAKGQLFGREVLLDERFEGPLIGEPELLDQLKKLDEAWIGGRTTTHGRARLSWDADGEGVGTPLVIDGILVLRLVSDAIFVDTEGFPTRLPDLNQIAGVLQLKPDQLTLQRSWTRWNQVGGHHAASSLPKHMESTATAGSTYRIDLGGSTPSPEALQRLHLHGVGIRRHEGFGHLDLVRPPLNLETVRRLMDLQHNATAFDILQTFGGVDPVRAARARQALTRLVIPEIRQNPAYYSPLLVASIEYILGLSEVDLRRAAKEWTP